MRYLSVLALASVLLLPAAARADGVIYKLPADGTSAEFDMTVSVDRNGETVDIVGTFGIKSVGQQMVDGDVCRWIEFKFVMKMGERERIMRAKVLVPENELVRGKTPVEHVKKAWLKRQDDDPKEITDMYGSDAGPLPGFLAGPLKDEKKLDAEIVMSGLGKLECTGVTGTTEYKRTNGRKNIVTFTNRLHEKAPFGIVVAQVEMQEFRDGEAGTKTTIAITLSKVSKKATSDLPDSK